MGEYRKVNPHELDTAKSACFLNTNLITASLMSSYSLCTEFVRDWFLSKFSKTFFSFVHVNDANVLRESTLDKNRILSHMDANTAQLVITATIDEDFNRENEDTGYGLDLMLRRNPLESAFWDDFVNNRHISVEVHQISMQFEFRVTVHTRAQQLDVLQYIKRVFNSGYTHSYLVDQDVYLPKKLMYCIAEDAGYEVDEKGTIVKPLDMLYYMNRCSKVPILYKVRSVTGHPEFFARFPETVVHLTAGTVNKDDGIRMNHLNDMYNVTFNVAAEMPTPAFFEYHSVHIPRAYPPTVELENISTLVERIPVAEIPPINGRGWLLYVKGEGVLMEDDLTKPMEAEFREYFAGELMDVIDDHLEKKISPALFMDLQIWNNDGQVEGTIDWEKMKFTSKEPVTCNANSVVVYMDMAYLNSQRISKFGMQWQFNRQGNVKLNNQDNP